MLWFPQAGMLWFPQAIIYNNSIAIVVIFWSCDLLAMCFWWRTVHEWVLAVTCQVQVTSKMCYIKKRGLHSSKLHLLVLFFVEVSSNSSSQAANIKLLVLFSVLTRGGLSQSSKQQTVLCHHVVFCPVCLFWRTNRTYVRTMCGCQIKTAQVWLVWTLALRARLTIEKRKTLGNTSHCWNLSLEH